MIFNTHVAKMKDTYVNINSASPLDYIISKNDNHKVKFSFINHLNLSGVVSVYYNKKLELTGEIEANKEKGFMIDKTKLNKGLNEIKVIISDYEGNCASKKYNLFHDIDELVLSDITYEKNRYILNKYKGLEKNLILSEYYMIPDRPVAKITTIGLTAFQDNEIIETVVLGDYVDTIEAYAFNDCKKLRTVKIGKGIRSIGGGAFINNESLIEVKIESTTPPILLGDNAFDSNYNSYPILVPNDYVNVYRTSPRWSEYADRIKGF